MISYDKESGQVEFALNPYYKGNYEGVKPVIDTITLVPVLPETMIDQLKSGEVCLLNKCVDGQVILVGMALTADGFGMKNYARIGYGFCAFANEHGLELRRTLLVGKGAGSYAVQGRASGHCLQL